MELAIRLEIPIGYEPIANLTRSARHSKSPVCPYDPRPGRRQPLSAEMNRPRARVITVCTIQKTKAITIMSRSLSSFIVPLL